MKHSAIAFVGLLVCFLFAGSARAAVFNCPAGDVACLISAINTANGDPDADTIQLEAGAYTLTAEYALSTGLPRISTRVIIQGVGAASTIIQRDPRLGSTEPHFRILSVEDSGFLTLERLTIRNGVVFQFAGEDVLISGAGIRNAGTAKIDNVIVASNHVVGQPGGGGGIANLGTLSLIQSRVEENSGGGIFNVGFLSVSGSTIRNNSSASSGGGISSFDFVFGPPDCQVFLTNSTVESNTTARSPFGEIFPAGGGIFNRECTLTIINSTIARNEAEQGSGGGIANDFGIVRISNSTIAENVSRGTFGRGGGIDYTLSSTGTLVELQNTILARNTAEGEGPDCNTSDGTSITSLGNNLVGDTSDCDIPLVAGDLTGDPGLGSFQDDGTPGNGHFNLMETSRAVDAGDPASCTPTDQLGQSRVDGDRDGTVVCDIGAIELTRGIDISELLDLEPLITGFDPIPFPFAPAGRFFIKTTFRNRGQLPIHDLIFRATELSGGNLLLNADGGPGQAGASLTPDVGPDAVLSPDESFTTEFVIGLQTRKRFTFFVDVLGVPGP